MSKMSSAIGALKRVFISESTALQIYHALILPRFDYCSPVFDELKKAKQLRGFLRRTCKTHLASAVHRMF